MKINREIIIKYTLLILFLTSLYLARIFIIRTLFFILLSLITAILVYLNYQSRMFIDFTPLFFLAMIFGYTNGFWLSFLFMIISGVIPTVLSDAEIDIDYFLLLIILIVLSIVSSKSSLPFQVLFPLLTIIYSISYSFVKLLIDRNIVKEIIRVSFTLIFNYFYLCLFSNLIISIMI